MARDEDTDDLAEQPVPAASRCPECGGEPLPDRVVHNLSAMGYKHDDIKQVCSECGHEWLNGCPIGEFDRPEYAADLWCDSCDETWMLVHRVAPKDRWVTLHLKCPNCYAFDKARRSPDNRGIALVGYPQITGQTEGAQPYGYRIDNDTTESEQDCPEPLCIEHGHGTLGCPLEGTQED